MKKMKKYKKFHLYPGTDKNAFFKASRGRTKEKRSSDYYKFKEENQQKLSFDREQKFSNKVLNKGFTSSLPLSRDERTRQLFKPNKPEYVPINLLLDEVRKGHSSIIVSTISDGFATLIIQSLKNSEMNNQQKNVLRSSIAFVTSEVLNVALKKPLEVIEKIELFYKIGKIVYKVLLWFDKLNNKYEIEESSLKSVGRLDSEYLSFLNKYPTLKEVNRNNSNPYDVLGKVVRVTVNRQIGSKGTSENFIFELNYGYVKNLFDYEGKNHRAYVMGEDKPLKRFRGKVVAVIIRSDDKSIGLVVATQGKAYSIQEISKAVHFIEKEHEINIITYSE